MSEQFGFEYVQTKGGKQRLLRSGLVPPGQGNSYQPPRSNPHRAGHFAGLHGEDDPQLYDLEEDDEYYITRPPTSARRYIQPGPYTQGNVRYHGKYTAPPAKQRTHTNDREEPPTPRSRDRRRVHWSFILGLGMVLMVLALLAFTALATWWQTYRDDSTYGRPRTFQIDAVVGHNDSTSDPSHFIAVNLNRHVVIIELPGGDSSKAKIYSVTTLFGDGQALTPVTLSFKDVNHDGLPEMEIHIQDQTIVLLNDQGSFRPLKPGETIHV